MTNGNNRTNNNNIKNGHHYKTWPPATHILPLHERTPHQLLYSIVEWLFYSISCYLFPSVHCQLPAHSLLSLKELHNLLLFVSCLQSPRKLVRFVNNKVYVSDFVVSVTEAIARCKFVAYFSCLVLLLHLSAFSGGKLRRYPILSSCNRSYSFPIHSKQCP